MIVYLHLVISSPVISKICSLSKKNRNIIASIIEKLISFKCSVQKFGSEIRIKETQKNLICFDQSLAKLPKRPRFFFILQVDYIMSSVFIRREPEQGRKFSLSFKQRRKKSSISQGNAIPPKITDLCFAFFLSYKGRHLL